ncbi:transcriptional regulator, LysR family [Colwellia chukchiensis]|uniref:Transcriptional regulator, LysR family n=1 Tax=Colwellia chukchiensis TaxID=641665 RepID=A0A1H7GG53_9GAMM|nr:LysR substrate-binding domain-containing protein [Colwellia chukchiensis]SEK34745.1 transcriptional regulator, LysR family [Colwellia chukchiensis]
MKASRLRRLPSIVALNCFESAARHQSITKAGEELCLTQSAISRQIKKLELQLGQTLFKRVNQRVYITDAGLTYQKQITEILDKLDLATRNIQNNHAGHIVVGIEDALTTKWLIPKLSEFQALYPEIEIEMVTDITQIYKDRKGYDVGVLFGDGNWPEFTKQPLMSEELVAVCSPEVLDKFGPVTEFRDVLNYPMIHHSSYSSSTQCWLKAAGLTEQEIAAIPGPNFEYFRLIVDAAKHKLGLTIVPRYFVQNELAEGSLVLACPKALISNDKYYVVSPKSVIDDIAVQHFTRWLLTLATIT